MASSTRDKGRLGSGGERAAARFLRRRRYRILGRNYRCPAGEIDLICSQGDAIVFVEVKTRSSDEAQDLRNALGRGQQRRIQQAARYFLRQDAAKNRPYRFDLITIVWPPRGSPTIEHFEDAFGAQGE